MSELHARLDMPLGMHAPAAARHALSSMLTGWGFHDETWLAGVAVVVSELVTNAVLHGGGCSEVTAQLHDDVVTLSVIDGSPVLPRRRDADDTGGRGLAIIEAMTTARGVDDHHGGKRVWVRLPPSARADSPVTSGGNR